MCVCVYRSNFTNEINYVCVLFVSESKNSQSGINYTTTATIAKELLDAGTSPTAEAMINQSSPVKKAPAEETTPIAGEVSPTKVEPNNNNIGETTKPATQSHGGIRATDQLLYLADLLKFEVFEMLSKRLISEEMKQNQQLLILDCRFNSTTFHEVIIKII